jgi:hypothetical protein
MNAMDITRDGLVAALTPAPTLEEQLERAERDLVCAQMIDSTARMIAETEECERRIGSIKRQIAERDEREHVENAVAALGDDHAR